MKKGLGYRRDCVVGGTGIQKGLGYRRDWDIGGTGI